MLTEQFLNLCGTCLLNEKINIDELEDSIVEILTFYEKGTAGISITFKNKFDLIKKLCKLKKENKSKEVILDSILSINKFKDLEEFLNLCSKKELTDGQVKECVKQFTLRRKFLAMLENYSSLTKFVETFENNMFDDLQGAMGNFEGIISDMYGKINEIKRSETSSSMEELDLLSDDYSNVLAQIKKNYSGVGSVPSGYNLLDKYLKGGFQPKRLYIVGGSSGDGKSTFLINLLANALRTKNNNPDELNLYLYVTLENHIDESLVRLYCCCNGIKEEDLMKRWEDESLKIETYFKDVQILNNNILKLLFLPAAEGTIEDILEEVQNIKLRYETKFKKKIKVKMVYVDYLDCVKSGKKFDLYRLELGQVTTELKLLSVILECPVASPTQLTRCLGINTRINYKDGSEQLIKNLKISELIEGKNKLVNVKNIFPIEKQIAYKIKTKSGKEVICSSRHIWPTTNGEKTIDMGLKIGDKLYTREKL